MTNRFMETLVKSLMTNIFTVILLSQESDEAAIEQIEQLAEKR